MDADMKIQVWFHQKTHINTSLEKP